MLKSGYRLAANSGVSSRKSTVQKRQKEASASMSKRKSHRKTNQKQHSSTKVGREGKRNLSIQIDFGSVQDQRTYDQRSQLQDRNKKVEVIDIERYESRPQLQESSFIVQPSTNVGQLTSNKKYKHMDKFIRSTFDDTIKIDEEHEGTSKNHSASGQKAEKDSFDSANRRAYLFKSF